MAGIATCTHCGTAGALRQDPQGRIYCLACGDTAVPRRPWLAWTAVAACLLTLAIGLLLTIVVLRGQDSASASSGKPARPFISHRELLPELLDRFIDRGYTAPRGEPLTTDNADHPDTTWLVNAVPPRAAYSTEWALRNEMLWCNVHRQGGLHMGMVTAAREEWRQIDDLLPTETGQAVRDMIDLLEPAWRADTQHGPPIEDLLAQARIEVTQRHVERETGRDASDRDPSEYAWYWLTLQSHTPLYIASVRLDDSRGVGGGGHAVVTIRLEAK